jgi:hypothetical protein
MPPVFSTPHQARKIAEFLAKPEVKEMSAGLEEIAQAVAVAVEDKALTERIYEKCMEKFDGETNTLWMHLEADGKVKSQGGWNKRVGDVLDKGRKNATVKGIGNVDAAVKKFEKMMTAPLHFFWITPSNWDKKSTPLVAFVSWNVDPGTLKSITAYDSKGNTFELDKNGALAKTRPVIVMTFNERCNANGERKRNMVFASSDGVKSTVIPPSKNGTAVNAVTLSVNISNVTITYPYNQDENVAWDGGPEFQVDFFWYWNIIPNGSGGSGPTSGFFGDGSTSPNATYGYYVSTLASFLISVPSDGVLKSWRVKYWEDDGFFPFDDFIAETGEQFWLSSGSSQTLTNSSPASPWGFPAQGGTVVANYRLQ